MNHDRETECTCTYSMVSKLDNSRGMDHKNLMRINFKSRGGLRFHFHYRDSWFTNQEGGTRFPVKFYINILTQTNIH